MGRFDGDERAPPAGEADDGRGDGRGDGPGDDAALEGERIEGVAVGVRPLTMCAVERLILSFSRLSSGCMYRAGGVGV